MAVGSYNNHGLSRFYFGSEIKLLKYGLKFWNKVLIMWENKRIFRWKKLGYWTD